MFNETVSKKPYVFWTDFIRAISIILVVLLHASSPVVNGFEHTSVGNWMSANIYNSLARICVPLLFMISGYLLLGRRDTVYGFFSSRARKVLIPFLAWSVIYLFWQNSYANYTAFGAVKAVAYSIFTGLAYYHLWFLRSLLLIYLLVPLYQGFVYASDEKTLWYLAILWFVFGPLLGVLQEYSSIDFKLDIGFFTGYLGYFFIGYLLGRLNYSKMIAAAAGIIFLASAAYMIRMTYIATNANGDYVQYYHNYLRLHTVIMSLSAFVLLKYIGEKLGQSGSEGIVKTIKYFSSVSFGIYLIHAAILVMLKRGAFGFSISSLSGPSILTIPLVALITIAISWLIVAVLQKIPYVRAIVPG